MSATCLLSLRSVSSAAIRHRYKNNLYYIAVQADTYWYITHGFIERDSIAGKWGGANGREGFSAVTSLQRVAGRKAKGEARVSAVLLRCSGRHAGAILYELKLDRRSSSSPIIAPQPPAGCQVRTSSAPKRARPPTREQLGVDKQLACPSRSQVHARRPFPRL